MTKALTTTQRRVFHNICHPMWFQNMVRGEDGRFVADGPKKRSPHKYGITNQTIANLEKRGLVTYADPGSDRWHVEFKPTEAGEALADQLWPDWRKTYDKMDDNAGNMA